MNDNRAQDPAQRSELLDALSQAVSEGDGAQAAQAALAALAGGVLPQEAIQQGLAAGMKIVGQRFRADEIFLPEVLMAARAWDAAMAVIQPHIAKEVAEQLKAGKVVIGTVKADLHRIGKDFVATLLRTAGFEVHDLGADVPVSRFVEEALACGADIIGASALLTTTMAQQRAIVEYMEVKRVRRRMAFVVGGGPVTQAWADQIGADGYASNAEEAVALCQRLMAERKARALAGGGER